MPPRIRRALTSLAACACLALLAACSSFESRAREKPDAFAAADAATRARLEAREVRLGDSADLVYIALGRPDEKTTRLDAAGKAEVWIYRAYWQEYQGTQMVGYRREVVHDTATGAYRVIHIPDYQPIYAERAEDRLRVVFQAGLVSAIEQQAPARGKR